MRLFVAAPLPEPARDVLTAWQHLHRDARGLRWTPPENLHLTMRFLGDVPEAALPALSDGLAKACALHSPLRLALSTIGTFGRAARPSVLWVGLTGDLDALQSLHDSVSAALVPLGHLEEGRPFVPHVTLARSRDLRGEPALLALREGPSLASVAWILDRLVLYRSELSSSGARHHPVVELPLEALWSSTRV